MKIKDALQRDPAANPLINQGQARITDRQNERTMQELHGELSTFVCEGQYADGLQKIIRSFIDNLGRTNQRGAWVSGFFGSGKSHLLKMLCHLWQDTKFSDGASARSPGCHRYRKNSTRSSANWTLPANGPVAF